MNLSIAILLALACPAAALAFGVADFERFGKNQTGVAILVACDGGKTVLAICGPSDQDEYVAVSVTSEITAELKPYIGSRVKMVADHDEDGLHIRRILQRRPGAFGQITAGEIKDRLMFARYKGTRYAFAQIGSRWQWLNLRLHESLKDRTSVYNGRATTGEITWDDQGNLTYEVRGVFDGQYGYPRDGFIPTDSQHNRWHVYRRGVYQFTTDNLQAKDARDGVVLDPPPDGPPTAADLNPILPKEAAAKIAREFGEAQGVDFARAAELPARFFSPRFDYPKRTPGEWIFRWRVPQDRSTRIVTVYVNQQGQAAARSWRVNATALD